MTRPGENGLNIRTNASPKMRQDQVSGGVSVLFWLTATVAIFYGNLPKFGDKAIKSSSLISSQIRIMSDQLRVSLYMVMSLNVM